QRLPVQLPDVCIFVDVILVVPVYKSVVQGRDVYQDGEKGNSERNNEAVLFKAGKNCFLCLGFHLKNTVRYPFI
ncbi:MAG: hypothetical protein ACYSR0_07915, partial [Planctomycetota bacterium]